MSDKLTIGEKSYVRLPGRAKRLFGLFTNDRQRLYLGDDHLFVTTTSYYYERYKRFYLADVQSLTIQKSADGAIFNVALSVIAGLFATIAAVSFAQQWDPAVQVTLIIIAGLFAGMVLVNTAFGPTCQCHILTAVHEEPLQCLGRLYTAQRVVEYLTSVIENVQGTAGDMTGEGAVAAQRVEHAAERRELTSLTRKESGRLHLALFSFLLVQAAISAVGIFFRNGIPSPFFLVPSVGALVLALAATIRQRDTDTPRAVRSIAWAALAVNGIVVSLHAYAGIFEEAFGQSFSPELEQIAGAMRFGFGLVANVVSAPANLVVGPLGLYYLGIWRRAVAAQAEQQRIASEEQGPS